MVIKTAAVSTDIFGRITCVLFAIADIDGAGISIVAIVVGMTAVGDHIGTKTTTVADAPVDIARVIVDAIRVCETAARDFCRLIAFAALVVGDALLRGALIAVVAIIVDLTAIFGVWEFTLSVQAASAFDAR